jgi:two-component system, NarL family, nitrate/nitrite response regulator NarL
MRPADAPISVVVADDHPLYRTGLVEVIGGRADLELVAVCSGGREALEAIRAHAPDAALLDMRMRDGDGIAVLEELVRSRSRTRVVFLSAYEDGESVHGALAAGAAGYLSKETDRDEICDAIVAAVEGEIVVSPTLPAVLFDHLRRRAQPKPPKLGDREAEVMRLTADGLTSVEIGRALGIAPSTVKTHLQRIYGKLEVTDRASMVAVAFRLGLLS